MVPISPTIALMADFASGKNQVMASYATVKIMAGLLTGTVRKNFYREIFLLKVQSNVFINPPI